MVKDCRISDEYSVVNSGQNVYDVAEKMRYLKSVVVVDKNKPVGVVSAMDVIQKVLMKRRDPGKTSVKDIMTSPVKTANMDDDLQKVGEMMTKNNFLSVPVVDGKGYFIGLLTLSDILMAKVKK